MNNNNELICHADGSLGDSSPRPTTGTGLDVNSFAWRVLEVAAVERRASSTIAQLGSWQRCNKSARRLCTPLVLSTLLQSDSLLRFPCPHTLLILARHPFLEGDLFLLI